MDGKISIAKRRSSAGLISALVLLTVTTGFTGCATRSWFDRSVSRNLTSDVKDSISSRTGASVSVGPPRAEPILPAGLGQNSSLSLDDAITTALSNNKGFQATLAQIGMADGDYLQSSLLTNPNVSTMIPVGVKQWEWTLFVPIEMFLLRPERMDLADKERERIAHQLVQTGLTLVRDVQVAFVNLALAREQHQLTLETLDIRNKLAALTEKRLKEGDIAELEAMQTRVDALNAKANEGLLKQNISIAREQLALLMGIPEQADLVHVDAVPQCGMPVQSVDELIAQATESRPDLKAAEWAVASAERRCSLARKAWWRIDGVADYNGNGEKGAEAGPGLRFDIPIFNKNEGGVMRACAELDAAKYNRDQIQDQIIQQIRIASTQARQASNNYETLKTEILPTLSEALNIANKGFEDGGTSYLLVLQTTTQYVDLKSRMLDQAAAACRASSDLELSCGRRLMSSSNLQFTTQQTSEAN